ncbi:unnamed protein product [Jaminaea pallidilutea]
MPIRIPKAAEIHPSPSEVSSRETSKPQTTCAICHLRAAAYTCPTCNSPYCSLACFKDPRKHQGCVASFDKRSEQELRQANDKDKERQEDSLDDQAAAEQRRQTLDLLRKWQLGGSEDSGIDWQRVISGDSADTSDDEEVEHADGASGEGAAAVSESDLPSDPQALLDLLDEEQKAVFLQAIDGQTSGPQQSVATSEGARRLWEKIVADRRSSHRQGSHNRDQEEDLSESTNLERMADAPTDVNLWWFDPSSKMAVDDTFQIKVTALLKAQSQQGRPGAVVPIGVGWNCLAVFAVYTYVLLHLDLASLSQLQAEAGLTPVALELFNRLLPFLFAETTSPQSSVLLQEASDVTAFLLAQLGEQDRSEQPGRLMLDLYRKACALWKQHAGLVHEDDSQSLPTTSAVTALSDMWRFFVDQSKVKEVDRLRRHSLQRAAHKITFYAAHMARLEQDARATLRQDFLGSDFVDHAALPEHAASNLSTMSEEARRDAGGAAMSLSGHQRRRLGGATTLSGEMEALQKEVEGREDEQRYDAAWRMECQRLGLDERGQQPGIAMASSHPSQGRQETHPLVIEEPTPAPTAFKTDTLEKSPHHSAENQHSHILGAGILGEGERPKTVNQAEAPASKPGASFLEKRLARQKREQRPTLGSRKAP